MDFFSGGSLIPADNHLAVMAVLFSAAGAGFLLEKTRTGALLTGAVWTILLAILLSNTRILPFDAPAYGFVFSYFVPVLIPLFLMKADLRRIFFETTRLTGAFLLASLGTVIGVLVAVAVLDLGAVENAVSGTLTASYVGGSVNFAALADTTGLAANEPSLLSAIVAADNLASAGFLALLAILPGIHWIAKRFVPRDHTQGEVIETGEASTGQATPLSLGLTLTFALLVVAIGDAITALTGQPGLRYIIITVLALIPATLIPKQMARLHGGFELGVVLAFVFFGAIAAGANVPAMLAQGPILIAFIAILLTVHTLVLGLTGMLFRLSLPELITASNAAILGATTAPALAAAKGWKDLVTPGVLVGVLGYALGTVLGTSVFALLGALQG